MSRTIKKDVRIHGLREFADTITQEERDAWRRYCFALAEDLYGNIFEELRQTCSNLLGDSSRRKARFAPVANGELELPIQKWAEKLNLVQNTEKVPMRDLWLRDLAFQRVMAWNGGRKKTTSYLISRLPPLIVDGRFPDETDSAWRRRVEAARRKYDLKMPRWGLSSHFSQHFEWLIHRSVGRMTFEAIASKYNTNGPNVLRAVRKIRSLIDPDPVPPAPDHNSV